MRKLYRDVPIVIACENAPGMAGSYYMKYIEQKAYGNILMMHEAGTKEQRLPGVPKNLSSEGGLSKDTAACRPPARWGCCRWSRTSA